MTDAEPEQDEESGNGDSAERESDNPGDEEPEHDEGSEEHSEESGSEIDQVVGYVEDPSEFEAMDEIDTLLYSEEPEDGIDIEGVETVNMAEEGDYSVNGLNFLYDDTDLNFDTSLLEEDVSVDHFYDDEELENIAEELSGYDGFWSSIPGVRWVAEKLFGSEYDSGDLSLEDIADHGKHNEEHQSYLEAIDIYKSAKEETDVALGDDIGAVLAEYDHVEDHLPEGGLYKITEEGEIYEESGEDEGEEEGEDPSKEEIIEMLAANAAQAGGVDEFYEVAEDKVDDIEMQMYEELRPQVEEKYEELTGGSEDEDYGAEEEPPEADA